MLTWTPIRLEDCDVSYEAEPSRNWRLSVGRSLAEGIPQPDDCVRWCVQERSAATGKFIYAEQGASSSIGDAQLEAEATLQRLRRSRGRPLKGHKPTTGTERSKQRMDRLMATEAAAGEQRQRLIGLRDDLAEEGLPDLAGRVAEISRMTALRAVAEYTRRNSRFFVRHGPKMLSVEETERRRGEITALAGRLDTLAATVGRDVVEYQQAQFEDILRELHKAGFFPDNSLVLAAAHAFVHASEPPPLTRAERLRRVAILCCNFSRNLAFYRVGWSERWKPLLSESHPRAAFWRQVNGNFIDMCVLEWCKLFDDGKGEHYWGKIVSDAASFEADLLQNLGMNSSAFQREIDAVRIYRNKFVAHLDSERVMDIPHLDVAQAAVWFYFGHIVADEAKPGDFAGFPENTMEKFARGYERLVEEAHAVYLNASKAEGSDRFAH